MTPSAKLGAEFGQLETSCKNVLSKTCNEDQNRDLREKIGLSCARVIVGQTVFSCGKSKARNGQEIEDVYEEHE